VALLSQKSQQVQKRRSILAWEIGIVLIIKLALLWLLWDLFFSAPQAKHMHLPEAQVTQHLLSNSLPSNSTPASLK
jgi:hypothetical protein